jgi:hypothetical protein
VTLASAIISAAYREGQATAIVSSPTTAEQNEALDRLNSIILATVGNQIGQELAPLNMGGSYTEASYCSPYVPADARLILNLSSGAQTLKLHPEPYDGQRLAIADAGNSLSSNHLTLDGNGRMIESSATLTLSTNGLTRQWFYRDDSANWVKLTDLALSDAMPFPEEFNDYFITRLAMRLFPRQGIKTSPETADALVRAERQIRARYRKPRPRDDMPRGLLGSRNRAYGLSTADFNAGRTWR